MEIALDDQKLYELQQIIEEEKNKLLRKHHELQQKKESNQYLEKIADNYKQYTIKIKEQKEGQKKAFEKLLCYFQSIHKSLKQTDKILETAIAEEKDIENKIKTLDAEIREIIS